MILYYYVTSEHYRRSSGIQRAVFLHKDQVYTDRSTYIHVLETEEPSATSIWTSVAVLRENTGIGLCLEAIADWEGGQITEDTQRVNQNIRSL